MQLWCQGSHYRARPRQTGIDGEFRDGQRQSGKFGRGREPLFSTAIQKMSARMQRDDDEDDLRSFFADTSVVVVVVVVVSRRFAAAWGRRRWHWPLFVVE